MRVSVSTLRRRIASGQLNARREERPQGFRWLVQVPQLCPPSFEQDDEASKQEQTERSLVDLSSEIQCAISEASELLDREIARSQHGAVVAANLSNEIASSSGREDEHESIQAATHAAARSVGWLALSLSLALAMLGLAQVGADHPAFARVAFVIGAVSAVVACGEAVSLVTRGDR